MEQLVLLQAGFLTLEKLIKQVLVRSFLVMQYRHHIIIVVQVRQHSVNLLGSPLQKRIS